MKSKINLWRTLVLILGCVSTNVNAVMISITPTNQVVNLGDTVSVDVSISDFDIDQFLGDFDFNMSFNSFILNNAVVMFGTGLGASDPFYDTSVSGLVSVLDGSFEDPADVGAFQSANFLLFSIEFDTIAAGTSFVLFDTIWALGDQFGNPINDINFNSASITVRDPNAVPEPSVFALLIGGILVLGIRKRITLTA